MNNYEFEKLTREIKTKLEKYSENVDWLYNDTNKHKSPSPQAQNQTRAEQISNVASLSPQDFIKAYKKNPDQIEKQVFQELGIQPQQKISNYQVQQPQSQIAIVNLPTKFSSQEVLARVKKNENLADILSELSQPE